MSAFNRAFKLLKEGEPVAEFNNNDICPNCGSKRTQEWTSFGFGYPRVAAWWCGKCEQLFPHDKEYAETKQTIVVCAQCRGDGDYRGRECDMCNGTGWPE